MLALLAIILLVGAVLLTLSRPRQPRHLRRQLASEARRTEARRYGAPYTPIGNPYGITGRVSRGYDHWRNKR